MMGCVLGKDWELSDVNNVLAMALDLGNRGVGASQNNELRR